MRIQSLLGHVESETLHEQTAMAIHTKHSVMIVLTFSLIKYDKPSVVIIVLGDEMR